MATHFSVLAWRIPGTGEADELPLIRGEAAHVLHKLGVFGEAVAARSQFAHF